MAFEILYENRNNINFITLKNLGNQESVEIIPDLGGTVNKINLNFNGELKSILASDNDDELLHNPLYRGRILFPFNDIVPQGIYQFNNKEYQLPINCEDSAIHGFIYNQKLALINKNKNKDNCTVALLAEIEKDQFQGYPFNTKLEITYTLTNSQLKLTFKITNLDDEFIPVALGWHPYFSFDNTLDDHILISNLNKTFAVARNNLPIPEYKECRWSNFDFINGKYIKSLKVDNAFLWEDSSSLVLQQGFYKISIKQDPLIFKALQLYIPESADVIAIEPITSPANTFNNEKLGLIKLAPQQTIETYVIVKVD